MSDSEVKLRRYKIPSVKGEGWAVVVIGSDGYFSAVSDCGNYAHLWSHHGCADFRQFLIRAVEDWEYFARKLSNEHDFRDWSEETTLTEAWEYASYGIPNQAVQFVKRCMSRLAVILMKELADEKAKTDAF